jgi:peptide/nickel transport system substrate-binding protein
MPAAKESRSRGGSISSCFLRVMARGLGGARAAPPAWVVLALAVLLSGGCAQEREPGTVVMLIEASPISLDPRIGTDAQSQRIGNLLFDPLLVRDRNFNLQPWLAASWESPDPRTYIFRLRRDARFHDGRPLTARDVRYTFESLLGGEVESAKAPAFSRVAAVEALDDHTVVIRLKEPYASFLTNLTQGAFGVVPEGAGPLLGAAPVGSGPFRFVRAAQDEEIVLARNADYWREPPRIEGVRFRIVPDATTRALELRKGAADIALNSLPADMVEALRREPHLTITQGPGYTFQYLALNAANSELTPTVRRAIAHAVNRDELISTLWRGLVRPATSILPPEHWAFAHGLAEYQFDRDRARELLDAAGLKPDAHGVRLRLEMKTSTDQTGRELAAVIQDQLARVGIDIEIRSYEFATFYADIQKGHFDLFSLRWLGANEDPDILEYVFASSKFPPAGANRGRYSNAEVDRLIDLGRNATDPAARRAAYVPVQEIVNSELPYIPLWYLNTVAVHNRRLTNLNLFPNGNYDFLAEADLRP